MLLLEDFNAFRDQCHNASRDAGWWKGSERYTEAIEVLAEHNRGGIQSQAVIKRRIDPDRLTIPTKLCLIHSEISEAYEGYMSGENDQHLPSLPNALVEFGDTVIRIGDLAGYLEIDLTSAIALVLQADHIELAGATVSHGGRMYVGYSATFMLMTTWVSHAMESYRKGNHPDAIIPALSGVAANLARVVILCKLICDKNDWDLMDAAQQKIAHNAIRALDGGKAF